MRDAVPRGPRRCSTAPRRELARRCCRPRPAGAALIGDTSSAGASAGGRASAWPSSAAWAPPDSLAPCSAELLADVLRRVTSSSEGAADRRGRRPRSSRAARAACAHSFIAAYRRAFPAPAREHALLSAGERSELAAASGLRLGPARTPSRPSATCSTRCVTCRAAARLSSHTVPEDDSPRCARCSSTMCAVFDEHPPPECSQARWRCRATLGDRDRARCRPGAPAAICPATCPTSSATLALPARVRSPSALELWVACPVRWFVERGLGASTLEAEPEPLARGSLAHAA